MHEGRKLAIAFHQPDLGGASRAVLRVLPLLEACGWGFAFWTPGDGPLRSELERRGHRVAGTEKGLRYSWKALRVPPGAVARLARTPGYFAGFRRWLHTERPDVLHANTLLTIPEALSARGLGCGVVVHVLEMLPGDLRGRAAAVLLRTADEVVAVSEASAALLRGHGVQARVVHSGVSGAQPEARPGQNGALRVGTVGTVCRRKGSDVFLEAAERVRETAPGVEFRLVGECAAGPEAEWARALLERARRQRVEHLTLSDVSSELAAWDLFVLPSRADPFPLAVLEAMAAGVPVLASSVDGIPEQLGPGGGVLVQPDDPEALAREILALGRDPDRRAALAAAARKRIEEEFTLERQADGLEAAYSAAIRAAACGSR